jgi:peptidyl-prolyl cis-trans isomerase C
VSRVIDVLAIVLLAAAALAFGFGIHALGDRQDFRALYLLAVGGLALRSSTELLRPRGGGRVMRRRALAAVAGLALVACSAPSGSGAAPAAPGGPLPAGVVARVGRVEVRASTVGDIVAAQRIEPATARDLAIRDALFESAAKDARLDAAPDVSLSTSTILARSLLHEIQREAEAKGEASSDELARATARHWLEYDRPEAFRTVHAVVRLDAKADAAARKSAGEIAEGIRNAVLAARLDPSLPAADAGATDPLVEAFRAAAASVPHDGLEVLVEELPPVAADGRVVSADGGAFDSSFARAASGLAQRGDVSLPATSEFGVHVILLLEKKPAAIVAEPERRRLVRDEILVARERAAEKQLLEKLRVAVALDPAVDALLATVRVGQ